MLAIEVENSSMIVPSWLERRRRLIVVTLSLYALIGGAISIVGWVVNIPRLASWDNSGIFIQPNAALAAMLGGAALLLLEWNWRRTAAALGSLICFIGASTGFQHLTDINLDTLNTLLMFDRPWGNAGTIHLGRMGPPAATCWTLIGMALLLTPWPMSFRMLRAVPQIALFTCSIASLSVTGYIYRVDTLFSLPHLTIIALQTSTFIAALSLAMIAAITEHSPMRWLLDRGATGSVARRAVPVVILGPFIIGSVRLAGETFGWYETRFGVAIFVLLLTALLALMLAWTLNTISRHEMALQEADRRKDRFLVTLAHELRGPLAPLMNSLELLDRGGDDREVVRKASAIMRRQLQQTVRLVDDLLDVGRISRDKMELRKQSVALRAIVEQAIESCEPLLQKFNHRFAVELPPEPVLMHADAPRLVQVFGNLLSNACKYTPANGQIWLSAECIGHEAVVRIADNGMGIPAAKLASVFDVFTQLEHAVEQQQGGLGIGLYLVKRVVEMHGGKVSVHSDGPDKGSEFAVRLPV